MIVWKIGAWKNTDQCNCFLKGVGGWPHITHFAAVDLLDFLVETGAGIHTFNYIYIYIQKAERMYTYITHHNAKPTNIWYIIRITLCHVFLAWPCALCRRARFSRVSGSGGRAAGGWGSGGFLSCYGLVSETCCISQWRRRWGAGGCSEFRLCLLGAPLFSMYDARRRARKRETFLSTRESWRATSTPENIYGLYHVFQQICP